MLFMSRAAAAGVCVQSGAVVRWMPLLQAQSRALCCECAVFRGAREGGAAAVAAHSAAHSAALTSSSSSSSSSISSSSHSAVPAAAAAAAAAVAHKIMERPADDVIPAGVTAAHGPRDPIIVQHDSLFADGEAGGQGHLPKHLRLPVPKMRIRRELTEEQIVEARDLRMAHPWRFTINKLARAYGVHPMVMSHALGPFPQWAKDGGRFVRDKVLEEEKLISMKVKQARRRVQQVEAHAAATLVDGAPAATPAPTTS